ncbi:MAG TPA: hypothetical protein VKT80_08035, partial [Chloroflexota bacterium]|nr:hypothetical protein [Chloroflexota bacterium]
SGSATPGPETCSFWKSSLEGWLRVPGEFTGGQVARTATSSWPDRSGLVNPGSCGTIAGTLRGLTV